MDVGVHQFSGCQEQAFLDELEQEALRDDVPIIRQDMQSFLKVLLAMHQPKQILEVGTAVGFSALRNWQIRGAVHYNGEKYEKRISGKRRIFKNPVGHRITLLEGDTHNHAGADRDIRYDIYGCA